MNSQNSRVAPRFRSSKKGAVKVVSSQEAARLLREQLKDDRSVLSIPVVPVVEPTSYLIQEKRENCLRIINNIAEKLGPLITKIFSLDSIFTDFAEELKQVKIHYDLLPDKIKVNFSKKDIDECIDLRNKISHQERISSSYLERGVETLNRCEDAFGITSTEVPLRILACKTCSKTITRTAQPTSTVESNGKLIKISRCYDVQVYSVGADKYEVCKRADLWYPEWIWHTTYCGHCLKEAGKFTKIGRRYDWAPENRIDLDKCVVRYDLDKQAAMVYYHDKTVRDLTHVVSDGRIRRHMYTFYIDKMIEVT